MAEEVGGIGGFLKRGKEKLSSVLSPKAKTSEATVAGKDDPYGHKEGAEYSVVPDSPGMYKRGEGMPGLEEIQQDTAAAPDWEAINKKQLEDIESAKESYSKRKGQYDWL